jgi:hypothetical protein
MMRSIPAWRYAHLVRSACWPKGVSQGRYTRLIDIIPIGRGRERVVPARGLWRHGGTVGVMAFEALERLGTLGKGGGRGSQWRNLVGYRRDSKVVGAASGKTRVQGLGRRCRVVWCSCSWDQMARRSTINEARGTRHGSSWRKPHGRTSALSYSPSRSETDRWNKIKGRETATRSLRERCRPITKLGGSGKFRNVASQVSSKASGQGVALAQAGPTSTIPRLPPGCPGACLSAAALLRNCPTRSDCLAGLCVMLADWTKMRLR